MSQLEMNPAVDFYFQKEIKWKKEIERLRMIALDSGLTEELKWGCPSYSFQKGNVVLIHVFKEYCAFLFFKGALLLDSHKILIKQTENVQAARQARFTGFEEIVEREATLKSYIFEAIEVEKAGLKIELKKTAQYSIAEEFQARLDENPELKIAFYGLTPGRQRAYLLHFSQPKQSKTRESRVVNCLRKILSRKGLED